MPTQGDSRKALGALLREHGFRGSAPTFRRFTGKSFVAVVNLQQSGDHVYVNLGAHYRWLGKPSSWEKTKEYECAFRKRLLDFAANDCFWLDDSASVTALLEMMKLEGLVFFEQLQPDRIAKTAKALARDGWDSFVPLGAPACPETWARVAARLGDAASKKRFEAQAAAQEKALAKERAREEAEWDAHAVEMTEARFRAALKAGRAPAAVTIVFEDKPKPAGKTKKPAGKTKKPAGKTRRTRG